MSAPLIENKATDFDIEVFFDGGCPLCAREVAMLHRWDKRGRIRFTDIDQPDFDPVTFGKTNSELMDQMHGRLPDGTWLRGMEVFRRMYAATGFGWLVTLSRLPVVTQLLDLGYRIFAKHRLRLTGRCTSNRCAVSKPAAATQPSK